MTINKIPQGEAGNASGLDKESYGRDALWLDGQPVPKPVSMKLSAAARTSGLAYLSVVGLNSDNEIVMAVFDSDTTTGGDTNIKPIGVTSQSIKKTGDGHTAGTHVNVYRQGHMNMNELVWDDSWTDEAKVTAFEGASGPTSIYLGVGNKFSMKEE